MNRPNLDSTVYALLFTDPRFPWVGPTAEEAEVAEVIAEIAKLHRGTADDPDPDGHFGHCSGCLEPWPCAAWAFGEQLAVQWLGRAAERVISGHLPSVSAPVRCCPELLCRHVSRSGAHRRA